ncbi:MAG TPA: septal ring lytic transglycosylase RlpA family protein [Conexibacter sp.]|nr:septal ring lytic transglycosylase RlpA family protein [Conexibacter sp.]
MVRDATLQLGQRADVSGRFAASEAGRRVTLQYAPRGHRWRPIAEAVVEPGGRCRFRVRLKRSGAVRIALAPALEAGAQSVVSADAAPASRKRRIVVAGRLVVKRQGRDVHAGEAVHVRGTLLPRTRGRRVVVEAGVDGRWRPVAKARTRANGHFDARLATEVPGSQRLRVRFKGDRRNAGDRARAGTLQVFRPSVASWYALYGNRTACGQTLTAGTLGVAHKTLPCGTMVTFRYGSREVTVPVIDRGPFVGGREWDLTGATKSALGFGSVGVVWSTR